MKQWVELDDRLLNIEEAIQWVEEYTGKKVKPSNIMYLVQYGRLKNYGSRGKPLIRLKELKSYYESKYLRKPEDLRDGINWHLAFAEYSEAERTKHVHRLHPYKGKFIPQLVEYFLDDHTDDFKKEVYFQKGDIVLDPFCGSGTTLVQANELGLHAVGVDISEFNALLSNVKVRKHNLVLIAQKIKDLTAKLKRLQKNEPTSAFDEELQEKLKAFNEKHFPSPDFKRWVIEGKINEDEYGREKEQEFMEIFNQLLLKYGIQIKQAKAQSFLDIWYVLSVRKELDLLAEEIKGIKEQDVKEVLYIILSRTARSCRATTHSDLATLKEPVYTPYYCKKHKKICKPVFTTLKWWEYYSEDTLKRLREFDKLRTETFQLCVVGDSRTIDLYQEVKKINPEFAKLIKDKKIKGIFTSPPYLGLIDYHEQHAYAYEIFGFKRRDHLEIGSMSMGVGEKQKELYVQDIAQVLLNCKKYLQEDYHVFIVANDKYNLYPKIAELSGMEIVEEFKRPVLCRVEKNREDLYVESIFHLKEKQR
ncbi:MAG: DNA methyltransferase [Thermocrinis sp.]|jgi:DNA modification methylase|uniref:DNA methyltransferase n=1 Tax=Thermocrinis sp. TaxID=2024383 RepID=UPI003C08B43C